LSIRVLVCGGRRYRDAMTLGSWLGGIHKDRGIAVIIEGGAGGADELARLFAEFAGIPVQTFPACWDKHGKAAGPIRNRQMLDEGKPDLVVAFPGGRGTADMVRQARAAGVEVLEAVTILDPRLSDLRRAG
jgi:predicted Rossmann-fold nucleotide-binding protein